MQNALNHVLIYIYFFHFNREVEFTKAANCTIFCGTWNVNAKKQEGSLNEWLLPNTEDSVKAADIYAVGFQEIVDLNAMNVALNSNNTQQRAQFWQEKIAESLDSISGYRYKLVADKYLVGLYLVIYVKEALYHQITDVRTTTLGCGIMGMMGNKGGVSIRLSFYDSGIVFVCAHLAAHRENVIGRNNDYKNIYEKSTFPPESNNLSSSSLDYSSHKGGSGNANISASTSNNNSINTNHHQGVNYNHSQTSHNNNNNSNNFREDTMESFNHHITTSYTNEINNIIMPRQGAVRFIEETLSVSDHDIVIWFGDLNYRIDDTLTTEEVFKYIEEGNLEILRQRDQLNIQRRQGKAFIGFEEGILNFLPTYKYQPGTDQYETRAEKKLRAPAWCDRVLWKTKRMTNNQEGTSNFNKVTLLTYQRAGLLPSDHKPVYAVLNCQLKQIVASKERAIFTELMQQLQRFNQSLPLSAAATSVSSIPPPVVQLSELKIQLGKVYFDVRQETVITMKNIGESLVHWHFIPKLDDLPHVVSKRWISIDILSGLLLPGEVRGLLYIDKSIEMFLTMFFIYLYIYLYIYLFIYLFFDHVFFCLRLINRVWISS